LTLKKYVFDKIKNDITLAAFPAVFKSIEKISKNAQKINANQNMTNMSIREKR
jgi:hypothetical protein